MFIRRVLVVVMALAMSLTAAGCMSAENDEPVAAATSAPQAVTAEPTSAASLFDWHTGAQDVESAIMQLSEIKDARVLVAGNTALVGVKFDDAYKGEMTERIREMVAAEVKKADESIKTVAVTNETDDVTGIYDISDKVRGGQRFDEFKDDIDSMVKNITTMR